MLSNRTSVGIFFFEQWQWLSACQWNTELLFYSVIFSEGVQHNFN